MGNFSWELLTFKNKGTFFNFNLEVVFDLGFVLGLLEELATELLLLVDGNELVAAEGLVPLPKEEALGAEERWLRDIAAVIAAEISQRYQQE